MSQGRYQEEDRRRRKAVTRSEGRHEGLFLQGRSPRRGSDERRYYRDHPERGRGRPRKEDHSRPRPSRRELPGEGRVRVGNGWQQERERRVRGADRAKTKSTAKKTASAKRAKAAPKKKTAAGGKPPRTPNGGKGASSRKEGALEEAATSVGSPEIIPDFTQKYALGDPKKKFKLSAKSITPWSSSSGGDYGNVEGHDQKLSSKFEEEFRAEASDWRCMSAVEW